MAGTSKTSALIVAGTNAMNLDQTSQQASAAFIISATWWALVLRAALSVLAG
jgi:hypothetical protein